MTDDVTKLAGFFGRYGVGHLHLDIDAIAETALEAGDDVVDCAFNEWWLGDQQDTGQSQIFLNDLERLDAGDIAQDVNQRQTMQDGAVSGHHKISTAPLDFLQQGQTAPAGAAFVGF